MEATAPITCHLKLSYHLHAAQENLTTQTANKKTNVDGWRLDWRAVALESGRKLSGLRSRVVCADSF